MYAFSNYPIWYRRIEARLALSRFLEWRFVSCETGLRKPECAAFEEVSRSLGVPPSACLFVDDRRSNCEAARAFGIPAIVFEGADELRGELVERGVL